MTDQDPATAPGIAADSPPVAPSDNPPPSTAPAPEAPERPTDAPTADQYLPTPSAPAGGAGVVSFSARQREVAKTVIGADLTEHELDFFLSQCSRTGLDPFARQIHVWKDSGKLITMTSIDGLRLVAQRTGKLIGQKGPEWMTADGSWVDVWAGPVTSGDRGQRLMPLAARFWVLHEDQSEWIPGVAPWDEFNRAGNPRNRNWQPDGMPAHMLGKVAEALALRKAFPNELSGVYTDDELDRAESLAAAPGGSDDLPSVDDPLAVAATEAFQALPHDARKKVAQWWASKYVPGVLNTSMAKAKSISNGALYRFAPGSPHIETVAELISRAADKTLGADHDAANKLAEALADHDNSPSAPTQEPDADPGDVDDQPPPAPTPQPAPAEAPAPSPAPPPGPFTEPEEYVLQALTEITAGTIAEIATVLGITEAASLRVTVTDLFNADMLQLARTPERGEPSSYVIDTDAVAARRAQFDSNQQGT